MPNDPTVVVVDGDDEPNPNDGTTAFAAGVAAATAAQATEDAEEAQAQAETAEARAENAQADAAVAADAAFDARAEVTSLRDEVRQGFAAVGEALGRLAGPAANDTSNEAPAPEATGAADADAGAGQADADGDNDDSAGESTERGYGNSWWFGKNHR